MSVKRRFSSEIAYSRKITRDGWLDTYVHVLVCICMQIQIPIDTSTYLYSRVRICVYIQGRTAYSHLHREKLRPYFASY